MQKSYFRALAIRPKDHDQRKHSGGGRVKRVRSLTVFKGALLRGCSFILLRDGRRVGEWSNRFAGRVAFEDVCMEIENRNLALGRKPKTEKENKK